MRKDKELVGYIGAIVESIKEALNFSLQFVSDEKIIGNWNKSTKTWSGVMNLLNRAEVDLAADITLTTKRSRYVDFTTPLMTAENCLYIKKPKGSVQWNGYFKVYIRLSSLYFFKCEFRSIFLKVKKQKNMFKS